MLFQQKKPKQFKYNSRFSETEKTDHVKSKLDWSSNRKTKRKSKFGSLPFLLLVLVALLGLMYYLNSKR